MEALVNLQVLNLTGNAVSKIPNWLPKRLKGLQTIRLSRNKIESVMFAAFAFNSNASSTHFQN